MVDAFPLVRFWDLQVGARLKMFNLVTQSPNSKLHIIPLGLPVYKPSQVLQLVRWRLSDPKNWGQRRAYGTRIIGDCEFEWQCLGEAISNASVCVPIEYRTNVRDQAKELFKNYARPFFRILCIPMWNDAPWRSHESMLRGLDRAIQKGEQLGI